MYFLKIDTVAVEECEVNICLFIVGAFYSLFLLFLNLLLVDLYFSL